MRQLRYRETRYDHTHDYN